MSKNEQPKYNGLLRHDMDLAAGLFHPLFRRPGARVHLDLERPVYLAPTELLVFHAAFLDKAGRGESFAIDL